MKGERNSAAIGFTNQTLTATSPARPELPVPPAVTITSTQNGGPQKEPADSRFLRHGRGMGGFGLVRRSPGLAGLLAAQTISPLSAGWLVQAVLAGLLALLLPPLGALLAVVFVLALAGTPLTAAVGRCIPAVVADDDLVAANALRSGMQELGTVLGPPLAGLLFAASGARLVLGLDALTFLVVVPLALRLPALPRDTEGRPRTSFARDARDGLAFVWRTPSVLAIALGFWLVVLFSAPDDLILPFLATLTFSAGPVAVGVLLAAASAGLLAGLPFVGPVGRRLGVTGAIVAGFAIMATGNLLTAAAPWLIAAVAAQVLRGLAIPLADSHVTTYLQRTTPPDMLGRVLANVYGGVGVAAAAGYLLGGPVVDATSPRTAFVLVGCGGLAGAAVTAVLLRKARRQPATPAP